MAVLKSEAKFTEPFVDKREVIVMLSVQGGQATASATELDYDAVHALEQTIVDLTFVADTPQTDVYDYKYGRAFEPNDFCSRGDRNCSEKPNNSTTEDCSDVGKE